MKKITKYIIYSVLMIFCISCTYTGLQEYEFCENDLKNMLNSSTKHYKGLYFMNIDCGSCGKYLLETYTEMHEKYKDSIEYYFILYDCKNKEYTKKYLNSLNINMGKLIFIKKDVNSLIFKNGCINLSVLFSNHYDTIYHIDFLGYPTSAIIDKNNYLKLQRIKYIEPVGIFYRPMPWHDILPYYLQTTDFQMIEDTIIDLKRCRTEQL